MSKAVLISIRPKWVEKIASGEKTIEVRKTRPNIATPFKCYIYCSHGRDTRRLRGSWGKVVGEFICKKIDRIVRVGYMGGMALPSYCVEALNSPYGILPIKSLLNASCITLKDLEAYLAGGWGYGWHISDLKIYDTPRELGKFTGLRTEANGFELRELERPPQSWCYVEEVE